MPPTNAVRLPACTTTVDCLCASRLRDTWTWSLHCFGRGSCVSVHLLRLPLRYVLLRSSWLNLEDRKRNGDRLTPHCQQACKEQAVPLLHMPLPTMNRTLESIHLIPPPPGGPGCKAHCVRNIGAPCSSSSWRWSVIARATNNKCL